jgi:hypothetical protein
MSDLPDTIWAWPHATPTHCSKNDPSSNRDAIKYRRADLPLTTAQIMADPRVEALVDAATELNRHFIPYSESEFKADRDIRAALAQLKEPKP